MTDEARRILEAALQLPEAERVEIAAILADSIGDGSSAEEVEAAWIEEAKRRLSAYQRGETTSLDFEDDARSRGQSPSSARAAKAADRGTGATGSLPTCNELRAQNRT